MIDYYYVKLDRAFELLKISNLHTVKFAMKLMQWLTKNWCYGG